MQPWTPELEAALSTHARQIAHAAGNLCLIAELQAYGSDPQAGTALRTGLRQLRVRAAMVARAQQAADGTQPTMTWDAMADAFRQVTAVDLAEKSVKLAVEPATMPATWRERRPVAFFAFDQLAHAHAAAGATDIKIKATLQHDTLTITLDSNASRDLAAPKPFSMSVEL